MPDVLKQPQVNRQKFDPANPLHIKSFQYFIQTGNWGDIQFFAELPYNEVPMTVLMAYAQATLGFKRETVAERNARIDARPGIIHMPPFEMPKAARARRTAELVEVNARLQEQIEAVFAEA
jgi:hypothetical protein